MRQPEDGGPIAGHRLSSARPGYGIRAEQMVVLLVLNVGKVRLGTGDASPCRCGNASEPSACKPACGLSLSGCHDLSARLAARATQPECVETARPCRPQVRPKAGGVLGAGLTRSRLGVRAPAYGGHSDREVSTPSGEHPVTTLASRSTERPAAAGVEPLIRHRLMSTPSSLRRSWAAAPGHR